MIPVILLALAVVCWLLAAFSAPAPRPINWQALGLVFFGISLLAPHIG